MKVYRLKELAQLTGFTRDEVQEHLALLSRLLAKGVRYTSKHSVLLEGSALTLLQRMAELEQQGTAGGQVAARNLKALGVQRSSEDDIRILWQELSKNPRFRG